MPSGWGTCPQATFARPVPTDVPFVDKPARHAQGYPTSFPQGPSSSKRSGRSSVTGQGFGSVPNILQKAVDRLSLRRYVHADLGTTRIREAPNSSERGADRLSGAGSPDTEPSGTVAGGSTGAAVPGSFSDELRGHRSRSRKGQANRGEGEPERGAPRSTELETAKGYSGLPRVSGALPAAVWNIT
jgi:hypothetical protein